MESVSNKHRRGLDRNDGGVTRIRGVDVELNPPPDGLDQVAQEDVTHVIQVMLAAYKARQEQPIGWSVTPQISGLGRAGSIKTGYEARIWGWSNLSLSELLRARDAANPIYLKDMSIDFDWTCPNGETRGCLRLVISSQAGENARRSAQAITPGAVEADTITSNAPPPPTPIVQTPVPPPPTLDLGAPAQPNPPPPPTMSVTKKRGWTSLIPGFG